MKICGKKLKILLSFSLFLLSGIILAQPAKAAIKYSQNIANEAIYIKGTNTPRYYATTNYPTIPTYPGTIDPIYTTGAEEITTVRLKIKTGTCGSGIYLHLYTGDSIYGAGDYSSIPGSQDAYGDYCDFNFTTHIPAYTKIIAITTGVSPDTTTELWGTMSDTGLHLYDDTQWGQWNRTGTDGSIAFALCDNHNCGGNGFDPIYCGDNSCNGSETFNTCPQDCPPTPSEEKVITYDPAYKGYLIPDTINNFYYNYNQNINIGAGDYIYGYQCNNYNCNEATQIIFDNGISTSTTSNIVRTSTSTPFYGSSDYGENWFSLRAPVEDFGTSTSQTVFYKFIPVYQTALGVAKQGATTTAMITWLSESGAFQKMGYSTSSPIITSYNPHTMACSEAEWATPNPSLEILGHEIEMPAFNFPILICKTKEAALNMGQGFVNVVQSAAQQALNLVSQLFPVNLIVKINTAWNESSYGTLPSSVSWLTDEVDSNGNITLDPATAFASSTNITSNPITIWGRDMGNSISTWDIWRLRIRSLTTLIIWGAFIYFQVIKRATDIFDKLEETGE